MDENLTDHLQDWRHLRDRAVSQFSGMPILVVRQYLIAIAENR